MNQLLYIDLFCGAGGTSTGVNTARLHEALCREIDRHKQEIREYIKSKQAA